MTRKLEPAESGNQTAFGTAQTANCSARVDPSQIRDRIREFRRVQAKGLLPNPKNWRRHPKAQRDALRGLLNEIGYADALLVRELSDGRLMTIDGHLRAETTPDMEVPVLILDVTAEEADKLLLTLDPLKWQYSCLTRKFTQPSSLWNHSRNFRPRCRALHSPPLQGHGRRESFSQCRSTNWFQKDVDSAAVF